MILTCPDCSTQYVVKDGTIPPEGRQVRCAACKHSWHQDPEVTEGAEPATSDPAAGADFDDEVPTADSVLQDEGEESLAGATLIEPRSGPEAEERAFEEAVVETGVEPSDSVEAPAAENIDGHGFHSPAVSDDWREPPTAEDVPDTFSPFAEDEEQPQKRGGVTVLIALLIVLAAAAAFWVLAPPRLKAKLGFGSPGTTPLQLVTTHMDRQHLESGNDLLTLTGRVINPSAKEQSVPAIEAQLKNRSGRIVYSWTIQPPVQTLPAGGSASFNSAEVSVPPGGEELTITLGDGKLPSA